MKVIASAGTEAKVEYMRSLGVDFPFNYRKEGYAAPLKKFGPFDVYWVRNSSAPCVLLGTYAYCISRTMSAEPLLRLPLTV